jgi:hypothetical protein
LAMAVARGDLTARVTGKAVGAGAFLCHLVFQRWAQIVRCSRESAEMLVVREEVHFVPD